MSGNATIVDYSVELPAGGKLHLQSPDEVDLWNTAMSRYAESYVLQKHNDLVTLGALLQQQIVLFRCQTAINGMEPDVDKNDVPTGSYKRIEIDGQDVAAFQKTLTAAAQEMRALEKQLGIDKATREAGGAHTVDSYISTLKRAARARGIHINERTLAYEKFVNELRWRMRMLFNSDAEDRAYHNITPRSVLEWERDELLKLEDAEKTFAGQFGKLYSGRL